MAAAPMAAILIAHLHINARLLLPPGVTSLSLSLSHQAAFVLDESDTHGE